MPDDTADRGALCLIVVPTYNEKENIQPLLDKINGLWGGKFDILFVDDNSPDGTGQFIEELRLKKKNIFCLHRTGKMGLGSAYLDGFRYAVSKSYDYIFEMDADLSHDPEYLKDMLEKLRDFDVVVTSRFRRRLRNINRTPFRILNSIMAAAYMRFFLGLGCSDPMGGFAGYRRRVLVALDYSGFFSKGYAFQAEIKYLCKRGGFSCAEVPIIFKDRDSGFSKISKKDILEALFIPWKIRFFRKKMNPALPKDFGAMNKEGRAG